LYTSAINVITLILAGLGEFLGLPGPGNPLLSIVPAAVGALVLMLFLLLPRYADRTVRRIRPGRLHTFLTETAASVRDTKRLVFHPDWRIVGAIGYLWFDIAVLFACCAAAGHAPPLAPVVLAYQIAYLSNFIPVPGGIGVLDGSMIGIHRAAEDQEAAGRPAQPARGTAPAAPLISGRRRGGREHHHHPARTAHLDRGPRRHRRARGDVAGRPGGRRGARMGGTDLDRPDQRLRPQRPEQTHVQRGRRRSRRTRSRGQDRQHLHCRTARSRPAPSGGQRVMFLIDLGRLREGGRMQQFGAPLVGHNLIRLA
jgi:hypothetical protein